MKDYTLAQIRLYLTEAAHFDAAQLLLTRTAVWGDAETVQKVLGTLRE